MKQYLHSNMELLLQSVWRQRDKPKLKFTFQYGATSTVEEYELLSQGNIFTFQYGATSTNILDKEYYKDLVFTFQYGATSTP